MKKMQCNVSVANVMVEPSHKGELHTQLFLGDRVYRLGEEIGAWCKIEIEWDAYQGWVLASQLGNVIETKEVEDSIVSKNIEVTNSLGGANRLYAGSFLLELDGISDLESYKDSLLKLDSILFNETNINVICSYFLNAPYMWGGNTIAGIDCSGLSQVVYRFFNYKLPHFASSQMNYGDTVDFMQEIKAGDLAFFVNGAEEINHVGILLTTDSIIHASESNGKVVIDSIDQEGIINRVNGKRTHKLKAVKRLITLQE
jgi:hypothetical protein